MKKTLLVSLILFALMITGCTVAASDPALIDPASLADYIHPTNTFSIKLPPEWILTDHSTDTALWVDFFAPGDPVPAVRVFTMPAASLPSGIEGVLIAYQPLFNDRTDTVYKTLSQQTQSDGSFRLQVVADTPDGPIQYNDFIHLGGETVAVLRIRLSDSLAQPRILTRIANSFNLLGAKQAAAAGESVPMGLTGVTAWLHADGTYEIAGQIVNDSQNPVERVMVTAELTDAGGSPITATTASAPSLYMLPGEVAPFSATFSAETAAGAVGYQMAASGVAFDLAGGSYCPAEALTVSADSGSDSEGILVISGSVTNAGAANASGVIAAITLFNAEGRVIGMGTFIPEAALAPGENAAFTLRFPDLGGAPANFLYAAWGMCE